MGINLIKLPPIKLPLFSICMLEILVYSSVFPVLYILETVLEHTDGCPMKFKQNVLVYLTAGILTAVFATL